MTQDKVTESVHTPEVRDRKFSGHGTTFIKSWTVRSARLSGTGLKEFCVWLLFLHVSHYMS